MSRVIFIEHDGRQHTVEVEDGENLMQCAQSNLIPGVLGDCGGCCTCGTCHAYIDPQWSQAAGEQNDDERLMLEGAEHVLPGSRLICQIRMAPDLDGVIVRIPPAQR
jgi:2Fe-2S ferredoxin